MKKIILAGLSLGLGATGALADGPSVSPSEQALSVMVNQCTGREAQTLVQLFSAQAQIKALEGELAEAKKQIQNKGK